MRILLVTLHDILPFAITQVLNPANNYCAIVVDEVEPAKKFVKDTGGPENIIFPFYDLKECVENFYYDIVLCVADDRIIFNIPGNLKYCNLPKNKFVSLNLSPNTNNPFIVERNLRYFKEHCSEFDMIATGISYTAVGLDSTQFKYKLFNFGRSAEDLYYNYQTAKFVFNDTEAGGGGEG